MKKSRSVSCWILSMDWPVWYTRMRFNSSRILRISRAWMSMSVAWPCAPPSGWWIRIRECGRANRLPLAPAQSRSAAIEAAWPMQLVEVAALLHHTPDGGRRPLARLGELLHLGVHVGLGGRDRLLVGDRLEQEGAADHLLGVGAQLGDQLLVVPRHPLRIDPLPPHGLARVLDPMGDLAHHQRVRHRELVPRDHRVDDFLLQRPALVVLPPRFELLQELGPQGLQRLELAE